jgi:hypothetical protein
MGFQPRIFEMIPHDLSRRQFGKIGHQEFGMVGAHVPPFFAQYQGDITPMTQTHARVICPKGSAAFARGFSGNLGALIMNDPSKG